METFVGVRVIDLSWMRRRAFLSRKAVEKPLQTEAAAVAWRSRTGLADAARVQRRTNSRMEMARRLYDRISFLTIPTQS